MFKTIEEIISLLVIVIPLIVSTVTFIAKSSKNKKAAKIAADFNKIANEINCYIIKAEQIINYTGSERKQWVLSNIKKFAITNDISFDDNLVSELIEQTISLSKKINYNKKKENL